MSNSFDINQQPLANLVFYRSYSRLKDKKKESWEQVSERVTKYIAKTGHLTPEEFKLIQEYQISCKSLPAGRVLWVGGTEWIEKQDNYSGAYNCTSLFLNHPSVFGIAATLAMCGCGVGLVIEEEVIQKMPPIINRLNVTCLKNIGETAKRDRNEATEISVLPSKITIKVGDSKEGWTSAYQQLIYMAMASYPYPEIIVDFASVRPAGEPLKGFGGISNPGSLNKAFEEVVEILNKVAADKRHLSAEECCLIVDIMALSIVEGNIRRSAGMKQGSPNTAFAAMKDNLWTVDVNGNWKIDPKKDALRMSNHTQVFHTKPSLEECIESVRKQYYSGEGAIQYAPEAVWRCNTDIAGEKKQEFISAYESGNIEDWIKASRPDMDEVEVKHRSNRYGLNPCITADTWVLTEEGPKQVCSIIGKPQSLYVDGNLFHTTEEGFFLKGFKPICLLITEEGYRIKATLNHKLNKVICQTFTHQYTEFVEIQELMPGDKIRLHDHTEMLITWSGFGSYEDGIQRFQSIKDQSKGCNPDYIKPTYLISEAMKAIKINQFDLLKMEEFGYEFYRGFLSSLLQDLSSLHYSDEGMNLRLEGTQDVLLSLQRMFLRLGVVSRLLPVNNFFSLLIGGENILRVIERLDLTEAQIDQLHKHFTGNPNVQKESFSVTVKEIIEIGNQDVYDCQVPGPNFYDGNGFHVHNCGEIIGADYHCNLSEIHLIRIDPVDFNDQERAFQAGALNVAALLHHKFSLALHKKSRELDPIVGVSFTGLFDFFVKLFGRNWLKWWQSDRSPDYASAESIELIAKIMGCEDFLCKRLDRPKFNLTPNDHDNYPLGRYYKHIEVLYLRYWREVVKEKIFSYCEKHGLKKPTRYTTIQPSGTKSLLTNSSPGWHPPKGIYFIRRITFRAYDPIALAAIDFGYSVVPSQNAKAEDGSLLDDPYDPRAKEWLVEVPVKVTWADVADDIDPGQFSALSQIYFSMLCLTEYATHNVSATWELRESEIEKVGEWTYRSIQAGNGYISAAILARFDDHQTFPRLPFEPISKEKYEELVNRVGSRRLSDDFNLLVNKHIDNVDIYDDSPQDHSCSGLKCEIDRFKIK